MRTRTKALLAGVLAAVLVGGATGWLMWTHSPTYSLKQIVISVQQRDRYSFEKYVDVDTLIQSFVSDLADGNGLAAALGAAMVPNIKQQVRKALEDGSVNFNSRVGDAVTQLTTEKVDLHLERIGTNAYFEIPTKSEGGAAFALKFHMTQVPDGFWRVDRVTNLKDLQLIQANEERARKILLAQQALEKINKLQVVAKLHTSVGSEYRRKNRFQIRFKNNGEKNISGFSGKLSFSGTAFDKGITSDDSIAKGELGNSVWENDVNQFIPETEKVFNLGETDKFDVEIDTIKFSDGTSVSREAAD